MRKTYLVKKNPEISKTDDNWIVMNAYEFRRFIQTPEGDARKNSFEKLTACSEDDTEIYIECDARTAEQLKHERNHSAYIKKCAEGCTVLGFDAITYEDEELCGEDVIEDPDADVEGTILATDERKRLALALQLLSDEDYDLIYHMFLIDKPMACVNYGKMRGLSERAVRYRRDVILAKLKNILN